MTSVVDLGCGPGNSTELLADRFPLAGIVGLDLSEDMLAAARARLPAVDFRRQDIAAWQPAAPVDVIFANASLQWVPDHETLFPALLAGLAPGGTLAVQMPDNLDEPTHRLMREIAADGPWAGRMADVAAERAAAARRRPGTTSSSAATARTRSTSGGRPTTTRSPAPAAVVEWLKGTGLRPYLARLSPEETGDFLDRYRAAIGEAYPALAGGTVFLPFPRLFLVATR